MAAKKTTSKKTAKTAPRSRQAAQRAPESGAVMSRAAWGAIWAVLGLLCLLAILPVDGALLVWVHRGVGAVIGMGSYLLPFALLALAGLLFAREKGPVRLRGTCIIALPVLIGSIIHAFTCANAYDFSMRTLRDLVQTGMTGDSGGLLSGGLYVVLEWALSSVGALIVLLLLTIAAILAACRITPQALVEMFRPPAYEYEDEEERAYYEAPPKLPNVHEVAAAHAQKREERRASRRRLSTAPTRRAPSPRLRGARRRAPRRAVSALLRRTRARRNISRCRYRSVRPRIPRRASRRARRTPRRARPRTRAQPSL